MNHLDELESLAVSLGCETRRDEPMNRHTTFQIGGPADLFVTARNRSALQTLCEQTSDRKIPLFVLGNGSNLLVPDAGIRGVVVTFGSNLKQTALCGETMLECGAGASLASVCNFAKKNSLTGLEFAWGIPGSVGGAAFMNAGAYEHCLAETVVACSHVSKDGRCGEFKGAALNFGYRHSAYSGKEYVITGVRILLKHGNTDDISARMEELFARRKAKQPLEMPSAGSVFKRPEGHYAGALIEQCGLKGRRVGGAAVSDKHAGFIVNLGGATCADVQALIALIQETVYRETGVRLECEVQLAG